MFSFIFVFLLLNIYLKSEKGDFLGKLIKYSFIIFGFVVLIKLACIPLGIEAREVIPQNIKKFFFSLLTLDEFVSSTSIIKKISVSLIGALVSGILALVLFLISIKNIILETVIAVLASYLMMVFISNGGRGLLYLGDVVLRMLLS